MVGRRPGDGGPCTVAEVAPLVVLCPWSGMAWAASLLNSGKEEVLEA